MTAAYEASLLTRADELADEARELGGSVVTILGGARAAGLDPAAYAPLTGAALALGAGHVTVYRAAGPALVNDTAFLSAVADADDDARDLLNAAGALAETVTAALDAALADAADAADDEDDDASEDAAERARLCGEALTVLDELDQRLRHAIARLRAAPAALGETYEAVYDLIRAGGRMPCEGRWITGEAPAGWPRRRTAPGRGVSPGALAGRLLAAGWRELPGRPGVCRVLQSPDRQDDVAIPLRPDFRDYPARLSEALNAVIAWQRRHHRSARHRR